MKGVVAAHKYSCDVMGRLIIGRAISINADGPVLFIEGNAAAAQRNQLQRSNHSIVLKAS